MEVRGSTIIGVGAYVPERVLTNADLEKMVDTTDQWIVDHTGVRERRIAAPEQACSDLCIEAGRRALADAGIGASDLGLIIVGTITPDMAFPATACLTQSALGAENAGAFDLGSGCNGFMYGLGMAHGYIAAGCADYVLVIGAEMLSRITDWTDRSTCVLFGDGAGAAVLGPTEPGHGLLSSVLQSFGQHGMALHMPGGGSRLPLTAELIAEHADTIHMEGHEVFKLAVRGVPEVAQIALDKAGVHGDEIACAVMHQANRRIIDAAAKRLGIADERVIINLDRYGNTSAASIPIALDEAYREGRLSPGDLVLMVGFGAGFTLCAAVLRWDKERFQPEQ